MACLPILCSHHLMLADIKLVRCKLSDPTYQSIRNRHYVSNNGCVGQQFHYLVELRGEVVGIISGASSVWAVKSRDNYFGLTKDNKYVALPSIINNVVFRLEVSEPNLGTQVLSMWRKRIAIDWESRYGVAVHGFETFIIGNDRRKGALYKADNWTFLGNTAGSSKAHHGPGSSLDNVSTRIPTCIKMIFGKKIKNTSLSTSYTSTWRGKPKSTASLEEFLE